MRRDRKHGIGIAAALVMISFSGAAVAGLVDHYEFEGDAVDSVGGDANGIVGANVTFAPGKYGQAAVFGTVSIGSDDRIEVPQAIAFDPGMGDFSITCWVKGTQAESATDDGVLDSMAPGGGPGYSLRVTGPPSHDRLGGRIEDASGYVASPTSAYTVVPRTAWHHFAMTVDRTASETWARLYIDGELMFTWQQTGMTDVIAPSQDLWIGEIDGLGLDGLLDDLRFYDHALSAQEIQDLVPESKVLVDHYELENDGVDSAGGDANGTVGASVTFGPGVFGQAAVFGTQSADNSITVPSGDAFEPWTSNFSIAFWVKRDQADTGTTDGVFDCLNDFTPGYQCFFEGDNDANPNKLNFTFRDGNGRYLNFRSAAAMTDTTEFHHYVLTVDRTADEAKIYINGFADSIHDIGLLTSIIYPYSDLRIGRLNDGERALDGQLDDLRFYSYILTSTEVADLAGASCESMNSLVDHYELESDAADSVGGDADGTVGANIAFIPGPVGQAATGFGVGIGPDESIIVPRFNAFTPGPCDFSIAFWVKRDQADTGNADGVLDTLSGEGVGYQVNFTADNRLTMRLDDVAGAWAQIFAQTAVTDTTDWHHYALTVDRAGVLASLYIDGALDATLDISAITDSISLSQDLRLGGYNTQGLDGSLDDVRFYGYVLTQSEVEALAQGCPGDLDGDGDVDLADLAQLLTNYGTTSGATYEDGDLDGDSDVDLSDLAALLATYGVFCP